MHIHAEVGSPLHHAAIAVHRARWGTDAVYFVTQEDIEIAAAALDSIIRKFEVPNPNENA